MTLRSLLVRALLASVAVGVAGGLVVLVGANAGQPVVLVVALLVVVFVALLVAYGFSRARRSVTTYW